MTSSMRRQTRALAVVASAHEKRVIAKENSVESLKEGKSQRTVHNVNSVSMGLVFFPKKMVKEKRWDVLGQHFHLEKSSKVGVPSVLTTDEERMIVERLNYNANKGFALGYKHLRQVIADVANDGRDRAYTNFYANGDSISSCRARHRDLTFRNSEKRGRQTKRRTFRAR